MEIIVEGNADCPFVKDRVYNRCAIMEIGCDENICPLNEAPILIRKEFFIYLPVWLKKKEKKQK